MSDLKLEFDRVMKVFKRGDEEVVALGDVSYTFKAGKFYTITGPSGSGKSTFLNVAAGLLEPDHGKVYLNDYSIYDSREYERTKLRANLIGMIHQFFNLIPFLTVKENLMMAASVSNNEINMEKIYELAESLGISHRLSHYPHEISGGEAQRVAIGMALVRGAKIILADEPTGELNTELTEEITDMLYGIAENGAIVIVATHDSYITGKSDVSIRINDGKLIL